MKKIPGSQFRNRIWKRIENLSIVFPVPIQELSKKKNSQNGEIFKILRTKYLNRKFRLNFGSWLQIRFPIWLRYFILPKLDRNIVEIRNKFGQKKSLKLNFEITFEFVSKILSILHPVWLKTFRSISPKKDLMYIIWKKVFKITKIKNIDLITPSGSVLVVDLKLFRCPNSAATLRCLNTIKKLWKLGVNSVKKLLEPNFEIRFEFVSKKWLFCTQIQFSSFPKNFLPKKHDAHSMEKFSKPKEPKKLSYDQISTQFYLLILGMDKFSNFQKLTKLC